MKRSFYIALLSALLTAGVIQAAPAFAQTVQHGDAVVSFVRTGDLNLATDAGQRQLDRRISIAAREVCGAASDTDIAGKNDVRECRDEVIARARVQKTALIATAGRRDVTIAITASR